MNTNPKKKMTGETPEVRSNKRKPREEKEREKREKRERKRERKEKTKEKEGKREKRGEKERLDPVQLCETQKTSLNNRLFKNIQHVGSLWHFVICCICVFVYLYLCICAFDKWEYNF